MGVLYDQNSILIASSFSMIYHAINRNTVKYCIEAFYCRFHWSKLSYQLTGLHTKMLHTNLGTSSHDVFAKNLLWPPHVSKYRHMPEVRGLRGSCTMGRGTHSGSSTHLYPLMRPLNTCDHDR